MQARDTCGSHIVEDTPAAAVGNICTSGIPRDSGKEQQWDGNGVAELVESLTPLGFFREVCEEQNEILGRASKLLHISICTTGCSKPSGKKKSEGRLTEAAGQVEHC